MLTKPKKTKLIWEMIFLGIVGYSLDFQKKFFFDFHIFEFPDFPGFFSDFLSLSNLLVVGVGDTA